MKTATPCPHLGQIRVIAADETTCPECVPLGVRRAHLRLTQALVAAGRRARAFTHDLAGARGRWLSELGAEVRPAICWSLSR